MSESKNDDAEFWGIACYFNPQKYKNSLPNYRVFREGAKRQGLPLLTVELAFGDDAFVLEPHDADKLIQVRAKDVIGQKERLHNIALQYLPDSCKKFAWLDADIIFENEHWVSEASERLDKYPAVQLFEYAIWLPKGVRSNANPDSPIGKQLGMRQPSHVFCMHNNIKDIYPHPGFAWAVRREVFQDIGLYDSLIMGSGDVVHVDALCDQVVNPKRVPYFYYRKDFLEDIKRWQNVVRARTGGQVSYIKGNILHLYHGSLKNRRYDFRDDAMKHFDFDPKNDLKLNKDQCFEWASNKPGLHKYMRDYFWIRNEDSCWKREILLFCMRQKYLPIIICKFALRAYVFFIKRIKFILALLKMKVRFGRNERI